MNILRKMVDGFVAWNQKPRERTPEQVAALLRAALDGTATHRDMDYFISIDIADPTLNEIKDEVGSLYGPGWGDDYTRERLEGLLRRVEALMP
jgi:hypothetical protein